MFIKLTPSQTKKYNDWLDLYEIKYRKNPTYVERTMCFFAIREKTTPYWTCD